MREDRRLIFIPELWKRNNKKKNSIDNLKKNWDLLPTPGYSRAFDTYAVRICPLFSSPPRVIWQLKSPHPREFATKPKKNC